MQCYLFLQIHNQGLNREYFCMIFTSSNVPIETFILDIYSNYIERRPFLKQKAGYTTILIVP